MSALKIHGRRVSSSPDPEWSQPELTSDKCAAACAAASGCLPVHPSPAPLTSNGLLACSTSSSALHTSKPLHPFVVTTPTCRTFPSSQTTSEAPFDRHEPPHIQTRHAVDTRSHAFQVQGRAPLREAQGRGRAHPPEVRRPYSRT